MICIYGCGGHGRSVADVVLSLDANSMLIFADENARPGETVMGFPVVHPKGAEAQAYRYVLAIGDNVRRAAIYDRLKTSATLDKLISPRAYVGVNASMQSSVIAMHDVHIGPCTVIGVNCLLNTGCIVEHDCVVGNHSHVAPGAVICGGVTLGEFVVIGAGAVVRDGVKLASYVTVGAGAIVVEDIVQPGVYVGAPARRIG